MNSKKISANIDVWTYNPRLQANLAVIPSVSTAFYLNLNPFSSLLWVGWMFVSLCCHFKALKSPTSLCYLGSELTSNTSLLFSEAAGFPLSYSLVHRACRAAGLMQTHCVHVCDSKPKRLGGKKWLKYSSEAQACASSCLCTLCFKAAWYLRSLWKAWITLTKPKWPRFILSWPKGRVPNARN